MADKVRLLKKLLYSVIKAIKDYLMEDVSTVMEIIHDMDDVRKHIQVIQTVSSVNQMLSDVVLPEKYVYEEVKFISDNAEFREFQTRMHYALWLIHARLHSLPYQIDETDNPARLISLARALKQAKEELHHFSMTVQDPSSEDGGVFEKTDAVRSDTDDTFSSHSYNEETAEDDAVQTNGVRSEEPESASRVLSIADKEDSNSLQTVATPSKEIDTLEGDDSFRVSTVLMKRSKSNGFLAAHTEKVVHVAEKLEKQSDKKRNEQLAKSTSTLVTRPPVHVRHHSVDGSKAMTGSEDFNELYKGGTGSSTNKGKPVAHLRTLSLNMIPTNSDSESDSSDDDEDSDTNSILRLRDLPRFRRKSEVKDEDVDDHDEEEEEEEAEVFARLRSATPPLDIDLSTFDPRTEAVLSRNEIDPSLVNSDASLRKWFNNRQRSAALDDTSKSMAKGKYSDPVVRQRSPGEASMRRSPVDPMIRGRSPFYSDQRSEEEIRKSGEVIAVRRPSKDLIELAKGRTSKEPSDVSKHSSHNSDMETRLPSSSPSLGLTSAISSSGIISRSGSADNIGTSSSALDEIISLRSEVKELRALLHQTISQLGHLHQEHEILKAKLSLASSGDSGMLKEASGPKKPPFYPNPVVKKLPIS